MKLFCLEVRGDYACFTRPEMKVERVSYDVITPSAARAVFEAILWKPAIRWRIRRIDVLKPVRWISVRRNEVGAVASTPTLTAMNGGHGDMALYIEDKRQQRASLFLRDVAYRLYADMDLLTGEAQTNPNKYVAMFNRRTELGQCVNQPYLGCREFAARFRAVPLGSDRQGGYEPTAGEPEAQTEWSADLGWMLYDMDYVSRTSPLPRFFRAKVNRGVLNLTAAEVRG